LADVKLALDNVGWNPLGFDAGDMQELPLQTIKDQTKLTRAIAVINPLIKRGISVRTAYIWGNGITLDGLDEESPFCKSAVNQKYLLSEKAQMELESCLATDGNFFLLVTKEPCAPLADHRNHHQPGERRGNLVLPARMGANGDKSGLRGGGGHQDHRILPGHRL
jgi:hypothetical protein